MTYLFITKDLRSTGHHVSSIKKAKAFKAISSDDWMLVKNSDYIKNKLFEINPFKYPIVNMPNYL